MIDLRNRLEPYLGEIGSIFTKTGLNDEDRTTDDGISRKMAIETVSNMFAVTATQKDMVEDCLEILKNLPSLKFATDINVGDTIYRQQAIDALGEEPKYKQSIIKTYAEGRNDQWFDDVAKLTLVPSAHPTYTDEEIQRMQDLESAEIEKAYQLGYEEGKKDARPERKRGEWVYKYLPAKVGSKNLTEVIFCSKCRYVVQSYPSKYCPNCGRRMVGESN